MNLRRSAFLLIFGFLLMVYILMAMSHSLFVIQRIASLQPLGKGVEVRPLREVRWVEVPSARFVQTGDWIRTGPQAGAELRWADGTRMVLAPGTEMEVRKSHFNRLNRSETSLFRLQRGKVWTWVRRLLTSDSRFEIQTPGAVAGVRGTVFSVAVEENGHTRVAVLEGRVSVRSRWEEWTLWSGQAWETEARRVRPLSPSEQEEWKRLEGRQGPPLNLESPPPRWTLEPFLQLRGSTEPDAFLFLNGQPWALQPQGRFEARVPLRKGLNRLELRAVARDGRESRLTLEVRRLAVDTPNPEPD